MATFKPIGGYDEVEFVPLIDSLRSVSVDGTVPSGEYVGFYTSVYDMVASKPDAGKIENLKYNSEANTFTITYIDGTTEDIPLADKFLLSAVYNKSTYIASFALNDGTIIKLDLNALREQFYTKEEIDEKFEEVNKALDEKDSIQWNFF
jgi:hypothetical protein